MNTYNIIKNSNFFHVLDDEEIKYIVENSIKKNIERGTIMHTPQEICKYITVVLEGKIFSATYSLNGKEQIICSFNQGMVFGFPVVFGDMTYPENIIAETDCKLLYISREIILQLFKNKNFLMEFIKKLARKIKDFSELIEILSYTSVRERIGKYLLKIAKATDANEITLNKNKTRLAKEFGTSRVVVSRVFKALEDNDIIKRNDNKHITILDINALELFS